MGTTLENGVYLPSEGERNCYAGLKTNWEILDQKVADVTALQQAVAGALHREIVESLPTTDIDPNTIYMTLSGTSATENVYNEFMYVNNAWELIGTSATDLTNYYTKAEVDGKLLLKANDSDVVHKSGNETVAGQKTLVNLLPLKGEYLGTEASNNARSLLYFLANRDTQNQSGIFLTKFRQNKAQGDMSGNDIAYLSFDCLENSVRTNNGLRINFLNFVDDIPQRFILWSGITERLLGAVGAPWSGVYATNYYYGNDNVEFSTKFVTTDTAQTISGNKTFSSINGVEPSSLSMPVFPSQSSWIDISSYITDMTGSVANSYTPPANGYITFVATGSQVQIFSDYGLQSKFLIQSGSIIRGYHPVLKNEPIKIYMLGTSIEFFRFIPCQGNV